MKAEVFAGGDDELPRTLARRLDILMCPKCGGGLAVTAGAVVCNDCAASYPVRRNKIYFSEPPPHETAEASLKERLKRLLGPLYGKLVRVIAPVYPFSPRKAVTRYVDPSSKVVVDLGCGAQRIHPDVITVDLFDYDSVDLVCRLDQLPFRPGSVDAFTSFAVLEHVEDPFRVARSLLPLTREGGFSIHLIPFLYHFHESPRDYLRVTHMGALEMFKEWEPVEVFNTNGPISLFLLHLVEFLAILASFGNGRIKEAAYLLFAAVLFPIKYLDWFFVDRRAFLSLAPTLCVVVRKPCRDGVELG